MRVLFVGPLSPPIHGEYIVFHTILNSININSYLNVDFIDKTKFKNKLYYPLFNTIYFFYNIITKVNKFDVIYMSSGSTYSGKMRDILTIFIANLFDKKTVAHIHGNRVLKLDNSFIDKLFKNSLNNVTTIIILSYSFVKYFDYIYDKTKIKVLTNPLPSDIYQYIGDIAILNKKNQKLTLLFISNVLPSKGLFIVLDALVTLNKLGLDFEFHFAGKIVKENNISVEIIEEKIELYKNLLCEKFIYHGFLKDKKKYELFEKSHIFLLPTSYENEGVPISILEAMAFGCAIIASNWRGIPDIIVNGENGKLLSNINNYTTEIVENILIYYNDKLKLEKVSKNNFEKAKKFYADKYINEFVELIENN